jgi:hypothetical protein
MASTMLPPRGTSSTVKAGQLTKVSPLMASAPPSPGFRVAMEASVGPRLPAPAATHPPGPAVISAPPPRRPAAMSEPDRALAERPHALITASAPSLSPKTWYGMPAYARDGTVVCYFTTSAKFDSRNATFGINDVAHLDDGTMWPTAFALTELTAATEARIGAVVKQAVR